MASTTTERPARQTAEHRRRDAFDRGVAVLRRIRDQATPEEMERIAASLERTLSTTSPEPQRQELLAALTGGQTLSRQEKVERRAANLARYFAWRHELLRDALSAPEVARLLGTSRQTPHDRVQAGTLLAVKDRGGLRFPRWQFDPEGPDGVLDGMGAVLAALAVSPIEKAGWFVRPNPTLEGRTPVEALKAGEVERLVAIARGVGVS